jgi:exosome complex component RRP40
MAKPTNQRNNAASELIIVLPGENVTKHICELISNSNNATATATATAAAAATGTSTSKSVAGVPKLGTGLRWDPVRQQVYATCPGRLERQHAVYFVRQSVRRYRPSVEDRVVGIVQDRVGSDGTTGGDWYRVEIGAAHMALINNLSFEGATKRNKPHLQTGQLLYARVMMDATDGILDPILSCIPGPHDAGIPRKDWMTNEGCYGELRGGTCCKISTGLAHELLHPDNTVLAELAQAKLAFEVAIGVNGYLWIHSAVPEYTVLIQNAIRNSEVLTEEQVRTMVKSLVYTVEKKLQQDFDKSSSQDHDDMEQI